jgi:hypothetical protein
MAKSRVRQSTNEIADEIARKIRKNERAKLDRAVAKQAKAMQAYAVSISPEDTGEYVESFEINRVDRDGLPGRSLTNTDDKASLLEYGTVDTPEFAVLGRTAHHFGGTVDH